MAYQQELIKPYNKEEGKRTQVERMFNNIAPTYDRMNHTLALGIDRLWRNRAIDSLKPYSPQHILDIATGTGDFAILAAKRLKPRSIIGADISEKMMEVARLKVNQQQLERVISFRHEDCMQLSFEADRFDAVTVSYGVRNFEDLDKGLREICRVLKPEGHLLLVELSSPASFPMKQLFWLYSHCVIPLLGLIFSRDVKAYKYLTDSVQAFPQGEQMEGIIRRAGFRQVRWRRFTFGISTMYLATK
ncbi:MAG: bifunctional demethylmenaquinone methyltransferase/2-methoxy-6-polyprenyl-1,4-benzoquinol methylase UbiE [Bacteroidaceae bacterium]|nr:bifunctional demethylmenaquinone methyltransferase/2-methoxy-6-polyprenyl-1,4-benzoquinol methylase UbiE [Bacteroidaceae bacterium]